MKIKLVINSRRQRNEIPWSSCSPFVENAKAVLIHRPRYVSTHKIGPKYKAHIAIGGWCGNSFTGRKKFTFLDVPPDGKLVCARCEAAAVKAGHPPSDVLVGHHVHLGHVVPEQTCCIGSKP
jgi:hypothetical protein